MPSSSSSSSCSDSKNSNSTHSNNNDKDTKLLAPRQEFGLKYQNPRLPETVPILGLGCSSFSKFFWSEAKDDNDNFLLPTEATDIAIRDENDDNQFKIVNPHHETVQEWIQTILYAIEECGINLLDTAPWYGHGISEIVVGYALEQLYQKNKKNNKNDKETTRYSLILNTKIGRYEANPRQQFDFSYETTIRSVQRSIARMNCQYINVLQLHDPEFCVDMEVLMKETIPAMIECRQANRCRALGMTGYPLEVQYEVFQRTIQVFSNNHDNNNIPLSQIWDQSLTYGHFNLHDRTLLESNFFKFENPKDHHDKNNNTKSQKGSSFIDVCHSTLRIPVLAAAPLSMGLLTNDGPPHWHPANSPLQSACQNASQICRDHSVNISTLAILFALSQCCDTTNTIPCTLLGMKNISQVQMASQLANRFHVVLRKKDQEEEEQTTTNHDDAIEKHYGILKEILLPKEYQVFQILNDPENGPFASIWKNKQNCQWDGIQIAREFWEAIE